MFSTLLPFFIIIFVDISTRSYSTHHIKNFGLALGKPYMLLSSTSSRNVLYNAIYMRFIVWSVTLRVTCVQSVW